MDPITLPSDYNEERYLNREDAAAALTAAGFKTSKHTLGTLAVRGNGPVFRRFGKMPLYKLSDLMAWAENRLSAPVSSTSEEVASSRKASEQKVGIHRTPGRIKSGGASS